MFIKSACEVFVFAMFETAAWDRALKTEKRRQRRLAERPAFFVKHLRQGETLFKRGEPKECIYRLESGLIQIFASPPNKPIETIEEIEHDTVFGLGNLDHHIHTAIALADSSVSFWPRSALQQLAKHSPTTEQRQAKAIEREFVELRASLVASTADSPIGRLSAFLSFVSQNNAAEGRDPEIIDESIRCDVVADYLKMDVEALGDALRELERQDVVSFYPPHGLRICDPVRLERLVRET
jgi:CRP/FNR family transcriptional regulator